MPRQSYAEAEQEAWDRLIKQIDDTFEAGKAKPEEISNLAVAIEDYKTAHAKRFNSEKRKAKKSNE